MPKIDRHPAGAFCWVELGTTDQASAKSFYSALFGWTPAEFPMGPDESYTMFKLDGGYAAAAYTMRAEERSMAPPHWNLYIAVASADETAQKAIELGGSVLIGPFDVMTFGRMAVIRDPAGAVFCVWEAGDHTGTGIAGENGTLCWADLSTPDPDGAKRFYEGLFGWKIGAAENYPPEYQIISNGGQPVAGIAPSAQRNAQMPPNWMLFFHVADVDALAAKATDLGGAQYMPPTSVGGARLSVLADPQGAAFSIIQPPAPPS